MYRFAWRDLVSDPLLQRISTLAESTAPVAPLREPVARILQHTGGLPLTEHELTAGQQTDIALVLVEEAVDRVLSQATAAPRTGFVLTEPVAGQPSRTVRALLRLDVNRASAPELEALPIIGPALAAAIVAERETHGAYASLADLATRVDGVGAGTIAALKHTLDARPPTAALAPRRPADDELGAKLRALMAQIGGSGSPLGDVLRMVALEAASHPHPTSRLQMPRDWTRTRVADPAHAASIGVVWSEAYLAQMPAMITAARQRVAVCMFHASGGENHPTRQLLTALRDAKAAGADVRVLLDRDRRDDPYLSTLINSPARKWLREAGVPCRFDTGAQLLHSKFVLIDAATAIVGSHNWTAGSYAEFDDLSLRISSATLAAELWQRFERLWSRGD
jgi:DNA uptake protein ComE-like DNA-binding protein